MNLFEQLNSRYGWSSGRKPIGAAPARGLGQSHINDDVLGWIPGQTGAAIRMPAGEAPWIYRIMSWPGMEPTWMPCKYVGDDYPIINTVEDLIAWASGKHFVGLNIQDK